MRPAPALAIIFAVACGGNEHRLRSTQDVASRPTHHVTAVAWSPDGTTIAAGSTLGTLSMWDARTGAPRATLGPHAGAIATIAWSIDAAVIAVAASDEVVIRDARTGAVLRSLEVSGSEVLCLAWGPDGRRIATGHHDEIVRLWDWATGELLVEMQPVETASGRLRSPLVGAMNVVSSVAFSPDAATLAVATRGKVRLRDSRTGEVRATLEGHTSRIDAVAWSLDGASIASASLDGSVRLWNAPDGTQRFLLRPGAPATSVAFRRDGSELVSGADDGRATIWDARTGAPRHVLRADRFGVPCVAFSPDGTEVATGGWRLGLTIWNAASGARSRELAN